LENNVWGFGFNEFGKLGLGNPNPVNTPTQIRGLKSKMIAMGYYIQQ